MDDREFSRSLEAIILAGLARDAKHVCPPCACWQGPVGWHRHCDGSCSPEAEEAP